MSKFWLIYHPERKTHEELCSEAKFVYYDSFSGNQDPYIWNEKFLYSYCQLQNRREYLLDRLAVGDCLFFVSTERGSTQLKFLVCDLVFEIEEIKQWKEPFPKYDSLCNYSWKDHYRWWVDHPNCLIESKRYSFVASSEKSFQPIKPDGKLVNILRTLTDNDEDISQILTRNKTTEKACASKPIEISTRSGLAVLKKLNHDLYHKHYGAELFKLRNEKKEIWDDYCKRYKQNQKYEERYHQWLNDTR